MLSLDATRRCYELGLAVLFALVLARTWTRRGRGAALLELGFGFAVSQAVELLAVSLGRYRYPDWVVYFPPSPARVPLGVGLGWAALIPCLRQISDRILAASAGPWRRALLDGAMAVGVDLVLDPVVSGEPLRMWVWKDAGMVRYDHWLFGVPVFNFVGWFLLVSATSLQVRSLAARRPGERWILGGGFLAVDLAVARAVMALPW